MDDRQLLQEYVQQRSTAALDELVRRHMPMVYATALREVHDRHLAEDVTQAVFLVLMRRAARISGRVVLSGWLFKTARFTAADARKSRERRQHHEREAASMKPTVMHADDDGVEPLMPLLNEAIGSLPRRYREAVVMKYLQGKSHREVAEAQRTTENAARKRLFHGLNKLRHQFRRKGKVVTEAAAAMALAKAAAEVEAVPASFAGQISLTLTSPSPAVSALAKATIRNTLMLKLKLMTAVGVLTLLVLFGGGLLLHALGAGSDATPPAAAAADPAVVSVPADAATIAALVTANNRFALDLFHQFGGNAGPNAFFSPYGISTAVAMTWVGARGETAAQLAKAMHYSDLPANQVTSAYGAVQQSMAAAQTSTQSQFYIANSLWPELRPEFAFREDYLNLVAGDFATSVTPVDYRNHTDQARQKINSWVEDKTSNKIKNLLNPGDVVPATRMVLVNTIYFKGKWAEPFVSQLTRLDQFHLADGTSKPVALMRKQLSQARYADFTDAPVPFQMVALDYFGDPNDTGPADGERGGTRGFTGQAFDPATIYRGKSDLSFVVILPHANDGLAAIEKSLTGDQLTTWIGSLTPSPLVVFLPKFRLENRYNLDNALKAMGAVNAFIDPTSTPPNPNAADFSGMDGHRNLSISDVIHQTFVDVDEHGTEAAAATAVMMRAGGARAQVPPTQFRADHPFLFMIRENTTGSILFLGRLADPPAPDDPLPAAQTSARGQRGATPRGGPAAPITPLRQPKDAAAAALDVIQSLRTDQADYFNNSHLLLVRDMEQVESAAKAMLNDDGKDSATATRLSDTLSRALSQAILRADTIANRATETPDSRDKSVQLEAKLKEIAAK